MKASSYNRNYFNPTLVEKIYHFDTHFLLAKHLIRTQDCQLHLLYLIPNLVYLEVAQLSVIIFVNEIT